MSPRLLVLALSSSLVACSSGAAQPPSENESENDVERVAPPAEADEAPAAQVAAPAARTGVGGCTAADLSMPSSMQVGTVDGAVIRARDLGQDAVEAELEARREYCNQVDRIRAGALQRAIDDALLASAAREAGSDVDAFVQSKLAALTTEPTDDEIAAFYASRKKPDAPALELVAEQVKGSMMQERSREAFATLLGDLERDADIVRSLPDVRPAAQPVTIPDHTATFGKPDATVEIVEFSDFECPYCAKAAAGVTAIKAKYGDQVRFAYRHFPLNFHPHAKPAARYAQCANRQGEFWAMHDGIFALDSIDDAGLRSVASDIGLDMDELQACVQGSEVDTEIAADMREATALGVGGTPTIFINGRLFNGAPTGEGLGRAIEDELARANG
ncbi:MAG: DsbA family protein [bacterium]|nr:DsbA family protein [bacterium]